MCAEQSRKGKITLMTSSGIKTAYIVMLIFQFLNTSQPIKQIIKLSQASQPKKMLKC